MPYNTGNAMPSKDPRDLYDNATNFDNFSNGSEATYPDRFGVPRRSLAGFGMAFDESQLARDVQFQAFLVAAGYLWIGDYVAGITFTARNQYIVRSGSTYRVAPATALPYTLTGTWATDQPMLVLLETAGAILSQLAANTGAGLIGTTESITVQAALGARLKSNTTLATTNLNTLSQVSSIGLYRQSIDAAATLALNYPIAGAGGTLAVYVGSANLALQEFTTNTLRKFIRWCSSATGPTWTAWREVTLPPGGTLGQSLINTGDGTGTWGVPAVVDAGTAPEIRSGLVIKFSDTLLPSPALQPVTVTADWLSVTDANKKSVLLTDFVGSASQSGATTGLNALDTGTWGGAGTEYHLFVIYNSTTFEKGLLWSLSLTAPTMPSGFTHKIWISSSTRSAAAGWFLDGHQFGNRFYCRTTGTSTSATNRLTSGVVGAIGVAAGSTTFVAASTVGIVPSTANIALVAMHAMQGTTGGGSIAIRQDAAPAPAGSAQDPDQPWALNTSRVVNSEQYRVMEWIPLRTRDIYVAAGGAACLTKIMGWELRF